MTSLALDKAYENFIAASKHPRQKRSLAAIKKACDYLDAKGLRISVAAVAEYINHNDPDGIKSQSIQNSTDVLLAYVKLRKSTQAGLRQPVTKSGVPIIEDEVVRGYTQVLREERDTAIAQLTALKAALLKLEIPATDLISGAFAGRLAVGVGKVPKSVVEILAQLLDAKALERVGLELHRDRIRSKVTGMELFSHDQVKALRGLMSTEPAATAALPSPEQEE